MIIITGTCFFITMDASKTANTIFIVACSIFILLGISKAIYYFRLHKKDYLFMQDNSLSIHRGSILSRKVINFNKVERVAQVNDVILLIMDDGKEEPIYTDWLSNNDTIELKKKLKERFASKAISF